MNSKIDCLRDFELEFTLRQATTLDIKFDAPKARLYANEIAENPRFGLELLGDVPIAHRRKTSPMRR